MRRESAVASSKMSKEESIEPKSRGALMKAGWRAG
jgi:hypothetical protein